jgi:hypothetical protein
MSQNMSPPYLWWSSSSYLLRSFYPCIYMVYVWCDLAMFYLDFYCVTNTVYKVELRKYEHGVTMSFA